MGLFIELNRRRVFRVATVYLIVGWLFVQAASIGLPAFDAPAWALRTAILLVLLGFPVALALAWAFDMTVDGMRFAGRWRGDAYYYSFAGALALGAIVWFVAGSAPERAAGGDVTTAPSIAVLAFENMSPDPANAYFADGVAEEVLNVLARIDGLTVASRTSSFSFRGRGASIPEIAGALNVAHVLEGSVRRQGDRVRITAQLIAAETDAHLWSATFDRDITDIFAVQQDIGQAIADALQAVLGTQRVRVPRATADIEAYERFLRGRHRFYERSDLDGAIADLRFAVQRDPEFTEAWATLATVTYLALGGGYGIGFDAAEAATIAELAVAQTLERDPENAQALAVKGLMQFRTLSVESYERGYGFLTRAAHLETHESTARLWLGLQYLRFGYVDRALPWLEAARAADPLVGINNGYLGVAYALSGRDVEALRLTRRAAELGEWPMGAWMLTVILANSDQPDAAATLFRDSLPPDVADDAGVAAFIEAIADPARRAAYLADPAPLPPGFNAPRLIAPLAFRDSAAVLEFIGSARDPNVLMPVLAMVWHPSMDWLRDDAAFRALLDRHGFFAYWERNGFPSLMGAQ